MNPREQKLLVLILIVLAYAACDYFYRAASGFENDEGLTAQSQDAAAAVSAMTSQVANLPLSDSGRRLLELANNPLTDDPLAPPTAAMRATAVSNLPPVTLSGVINMGNVSLALIGGEEFGVGDQIPETGETVKAITNDAVTLFAPDTGLTRTIKVEDTDPTLSDLTKSRGIPHA